MGLLTSFHILFDMPKEDIGNSSQSEGERERTERISIPADCLQRNDQLSRKQAIIYHSESLERPPFHTTCTVLYLLYLTYLTNPNPQGENC